MTTFVVSAYRLSSVEKTENYPGEAGVLQIKGLGLGHLLTPPNKGLYCTGRLVQEATMVESCKTGVH